LTVGGNLTVDGTSTLTGAVALGSTLDVTGNTVLNDLKTTGATAGVDVQGGWDYGTFVPTIQDSSGNEVTGSQFPSECTWYRTGNLFHITIYRNTTGFGSAVGTDAVRVYGLPSGYKVAAGGRQYTPLAMWNNIDWPQYTKTLYLVWAPGTTYANVQYKLMNNSAGTAQEGYQQCIINDLNSGYIRTSYTLRLDPV
jgi:hypothetical protein